MMMMSENQPSQSQVYARAILGTKESLLRNQLTVRMADILPRRKIAGAILRVSKVLYSLFTKL
jgi:hypothetical protein